MKIKGLFWSLFFVWSMIISGFSAQNSQTSSGLSRKIAEVVSSMLYGTGLDTLPVQQQQNLEFFIRKLAHFSEYAVLGILLAVLVWLYKKPMVWYGICGMYCCAFASIDEWHQSFVPGRVASIKDVCIDTAGAITGIFCMIVVKKYWLERKIKQ